MQETISYWFKGKLVTTSIKKANPLNPYESIEIAAKLMGLKEFYWSGLYCVII